MIQISGKQPNSARCFICGLKNPAGLQSRFFELANGELMAVFTAREEHQGYPGRMHGGLLGAILDETIGRAIMIRTKGEVWGVTVDFSMRLKQPVPLGEEIRVIARITRDSKRIFEGSGELILPDNTPAVTGQGKYMKMAIDRITDFDADKEHWGVIHEPGDPAQVDLPAEQKVDG